MWIAKPFELKVFILKRASKPRTLDLLKYKCIEEDNRNCLKKMSHPGLDEKIKFHLPNYNDRILKRGYFGDLEKGYGKRVRIKNRKPLTSAVDNMLSEYRKKHS